MINYKIVLIENQKVQFDTISSLFRDRPGSNIHYEIFPKEKDYTLFLDCIKVYLNEYYKPVHNAFALKRLIDMIHNFRLDQDNTEPHVFIIDHKLVGCHKSLSGIDLAIELRNNQGFKVQPMIFLSRTSKADPKVMEGLPHLSGIHEWIPKGYAGKEILDDEYFKKNVLNIIPGLIKKAGFNSYIDKLEYIANSSRMGDHISVLKPKIQSIKAKNEITENQKKVIDDFIVLLDGFNTDIDKINLFMDSL